MAFKTVKYDDGAIITRVLVALSKMHIITSVSISQNITPIETIGIYEVSEFFPGNMVIEVL
jgi:hypothetical protein